MFQEGVEILVETCSSTSCIFYLVSINSCVPLVRFFEVDLLSALKVLRVFLCCGCYNMHVIL